MGAASASSQSSAMPQSQGKGGGAPMGGSGAPMSGGKGFSNQQPYSPEGGYHNQVPAIGQSANQTQSDMGSTIPLNQLSGLINPSQTSTGQSTQANAQAAIPANGAPMPQGKGGGSSLSGSQNGLPVNPSGNSIEDTYQQQTGHAGDPEGLAYWKGQFGDTVDPQELKTFQTSANIVNAKAGNTQPVAQGTGKGGGAQGSSQGGPQLPNAGQQGWQYGQGASGDRVTYPSTSGQQQFGQPMQGSTPYSNTIGQGQQSNQMQHSGKGKGA